MIKYDFVKKGYLDIFTSLCWNARARLDHHLDAQLVCYVEVMLTVNLISKNPETHLFCLIADVLFLLH